MNISVNKKNTLIYIQYYYTHKKNITIEIFSLKSFYYCSISLNKYLTEILLYIIDVVISMYIMYDKKQRRDLKCISEIVNEQYYKVIFNKNIALFCANNLNHCFVLYYTYILTYIIFKNFFRVFFCLL